MLADRNKSFENRDASRVVRRRERYRRTGSPRICFVSKTRGRIYARRSRFLRLHERFEREGGGGEGGREANQLVFCSANESSYGPFLLPRAGRVRLEPKDLVCSACSRRGLCGGEGWRGERRGNRVGERASPRSAQRPEQPRRRSGLLIIGAISVLLCPAESPSPLLFCNRQRPPYLSLVPGASDRTGSAARARAPLAYGRAQRCTWVRARARAQSLFAYLRVSSLIIRNLWKMYR